MLGVDCTNIAQAAPAQPVTTSINEIWNAPWGARPAETMPVLTTAVISEVARMAVEAAKERRTAQEARDFIPAKKYGTPPEKSCSNSALKARVSTGTVVSWRSV